MGFSPAVEGLIAKSLGTSLSGGHPVVEEEHRFLHYRPFCHCSRSSGIGEHFNPGHGRLMNEWIAIPEHSDRWIKLASEAYEFVNQGAATTQKASRRSARS
jgi:hypothetical protein